MTERIVPTVTNEHGSIPVLARHQIDQEARHLRGAECILAVHWMYPPVSAGIPQQWSWVTLVVDGVDVAEYLSGGSLSLDRPKLVAGRHTFSIRSGFLNQRDNENAFEPITVEVNSQMVVLVEVTPGIFGRTAAMKIRLLESGFSQSGRWGMRWNRRLGWGGEPARWPWPDDDLPESGGDSEGSSVVTFTPTVTVEDVGIPRWARGGIARAGRTLSHAEAILAVGGDYRTAGSSPDSWSWRAVIMDVDDDEQADDDEADAEAGAGDAGIGLVEPGWFWKTSALTAGTHTFNISAQRGRISDTAQPVSLDVRAGTVVLVDVRSRQGHGAASQPPSAHFQVVPSGFAHSGRWGRRMARRLGWAAPGES